MNITTCIDYIRRWLWGFAVYKMIYLLSSCFHCIILVTDKQKMTVFTVMHCITIKKIDLDEEFELQSLAPERAIMKPSFIKACMLSETD